MKLQSKIRILLVDDDEDDFIIFSHLLEDIDVNSYELTWAHGYENAIAEIDKRNHDIYFFDYLLGSKNGKELIRYCVAKNIEEPFIILTGLGNLNTDLETMQLGASDYLVKSDLNPEKLERCIRYCIEQSNSLKQAKENERKFKSIFENSYDVICILDSKGNITEVNGSGENLFGYSRDRLLQMNLADFFVNELDFKNFFSDIRSGQPGTHYDVVLRDKNNNRKYCSLTASVQKPDGRTEYYQGIIHDMTRRKKAENDLVIAEKLAVTGRIARTLAHEIRNPLTNINLSIEQLEEDFKTGDTLQYLEIIKRNSNRINDLVSTLMEYSKPAELRAEEISIRDVVEETIRLASDRARLRKVEIVTEMEDNTVKVLGDRSKLSIALLNIIVNALESVEEGSGSIKISFSCKNDRCFITIEDNGSGISKEDLKHIFEPYFSNKNNGMGLGLSTTHNIIVSHNGEIEIESEEGKGTVFRVSLDLIR